MLYSIPFAAAPTDLTTLRGLRFKVRASSPRAFRVEVESRMNSRELEGIKGGWDLTVTAETEQLTVTFADAKVPPWAIDPGDDLATILRNAAGITFKPARANRDASGQLAPGTTDGGWVDLDDIEFF